MTEDPGPLTQEKAKDGRSKTAGRAPGKGTSPEGRGSRRKANSMGGLFDTDDHRKKIIARNLTDLVYHLGKKTEIGIRKLIK